MNAGPRSRFAGTGPLLGTLAFLVLPALCAAQNLVHVEEDWELVLGEPDENSSGPQIATTMSPFNDIKDTFFTFEINHRSVPYWEPGGLNLHQWSGEWRVQSLERPDHSVMRTNNETVTWTQILEVNNGVLTFQIRDGISSTWGPFGYSNYLKLQTGWGVNSINSYSADLSMAKSGVAYAANRVKSLKIKQVRGTLSTGTTAIDNTERIVHQLLE